MMQIYTLSPAQEEQLRESVKRAEAITESRVLEIGREVMAAKRETFQPGGGAKPGPMFQEK